MARTFRRDRDDDDFENGVLRDGRRFVMPMRAMDSLQRSVAAHFGRSTVNDGQKIVDGFGNDGLALHRPGHRLFASGQGDQSFYDKYDRDISTRYLDANNHTSGTSGAGERGGIGGRRVGDRCTCKGSSDLGTEGDRGTIQEVNGELCCVSDRYHGEDGVDMRDSAYRQYAQEISEAWRKG